jgi:hypothetical protein
MIHFSPAKGWVEAVHNIIRLKIIPNHERRPKNKQISLRANARDNQFSSQLLFVVVVGDITIVILVVASHAPHFTVVS